MKRSRIQILMMCAALLILISLSGCSPRLASEQELEVTNNEIRTILVDPSTEAQTINVSAKTNGVPIDIHVYLSEDDAEVDQSITLKSPCDKILASQDETTEVVLTAKIPANKEASVRITGSKIEPATVTLSISN